MLSRVRSLLFSCFVRATDRATLAIHSGDTTARQLQQETDSYSRAQETGLRPGTRSGSKKPRDPPGHLARGYAAREAAFYEL